jgi:hypothetical protein
MRLGHGLHLAYCSNIHRGESWGDTWDALKRHTLEVRQRVAANEPFAIGLRLSAAAAAELAGEQTLCQFQRWLDEQHCYVFTINGFPYGRFHGVGVKEAVYRPDWTTAARLDYTVRLFEILAHLLPPEVEGSVSTLPGSFKSFRLTPEEQAQIRRQVWRCVEAVAELSARTGKELHLGIEPEPLCLIETTDEAVAFFNQMARDHPGDERLSRHLGVNYDACHQAVEFESPEQSLDRLRGAGIRLSKCHFSSALRVQPGDEAFEALQAFVDPVYLHQVVARHEGGALDRFADLPEALASPRARQAAEWRVHFHVPLQAPPQGCLDTTRPHLLGVIDWLAAHPTACAHLEMETYTWDVLPPALKARCVVDQLVEEYRWTLGALAQRGLAESPRFA